MRLTRVLVQHYRSIVNSGIVDIDEKSTVLIGKNEQGKSNFLRALGAFNPDKQYSRRDLPNHLQPVLEDEDSDSIPVVTIWVTPSPVEKEKLQQFSGADPELDELKVTRYLDNHYSYIQVKHDGSEIPLQTKPVDLIEQAGQFRSQADSLGAKLKVHATRHTPFQKSLEQFDNRVGELFSSKLNDEGTLMPALKSLETLLKGLPNQDKPIQDDIAAASASINEISAAASHAIMRAKRAFNINRLLPRFVFHQSRIDEIPDEVVIADFVASPEETSRGMKNLCAAADLSMTKISELAASADLTEREVTEDFCRATISGQINEFWEHKEYNIHFRFHGERLAVSISDSIYSPRIRPSDRSDGFRWYLSFYCACLAESSAFRPTVLLLDNPGLELHSDQQRQAKRLLEQKLPDATQVVYVTHSPAMIDPFNLAQLRLVQLNKQEEGTRVIGSVVKSDNDLDLFEPVRSAIGASIITGLVSGDYNVLVEGAADKPIIDGAFHLFPPEAGRYVIVNGSVAESSGFLPRFFQRSHLPFVIYVDADSGGRKITSLFNSWEIDLNRCVRLEDVICVPSGEDRELEDAITPDFYHRAVSAAYPDKSVEPPPFAYSGKRTKHYEAEFRDKQKIGFAKRRVADAVYDLIIKGMIDEESKATLQQLAKVILERMRPAADRAEPLNAEKRHAP